jgi:hypothetical protein
MPAGKSLLDFRRNEDEDQEPDEGDPGEQEVNKG